jgi:hypothetical protein
MSEGNAHAQIILYYVTIRLIEMPVRILLDNI